MTTPSLDGLLHVCHADACTEMRELMRSLHPEQDLLPSVIIGIFEHPAGNAETAPPKAPKPEPKANHARLGQNRSKFNDGTSRSVATYLVFDLVPFRRGRVERVSWRSGRRP